jgi:glycosyltransferase involved in cell wall biosynthesis
MPRPLLVILPSVVPAGAEIQAMLQIRELARRGIAVRLMVLSPVVDPGVLARAGLAPADVCVLRNPSAVLGPAFLKAMWRDLPRAAAFAAETAPGTVIAHLGPAHVFARALALRLRPGGLRPRLVHDHHSEEWALSGPPSLGKRAFFALDDLLARACDHAHWHVSERVRADVAGHRFTRRDAVLHNTCDMDSPGDTAQAEAILAPHAGRWVVLLPGRMIPRKGHEGFLRAVAGLVRREGLGPADLHVLLAGDGPHRLAIQATVDAEGLGEVVTFLGTVPHAVLLALDARVDLVAVPSLVEGFGIVAIEAMARGALVLASDAAGLDEIVRPGVNGLQFPAGDEAALGARLAEAWWRRAEAVIDREAVRAEMRARFGLRGHVDRLVELLQA